MGFAEKYAPESTQKQNARTQTAHTRNERAFKNAPKVIEKTPTIDWSSIFYTRKNQNDSDTKTTT